MLINATTPAIQFHCQVMALSLRLIHLGADPNGSESGYIRVYAWDGQNWAQRGANIDGESAGDMCCYLSISADGASVVAGAQRSSGSNNLTDSGQTRVFTWGTDKVGLKKDSV